MLSHVSLGINDADRAAKFYDPVLGVHGMHKLDQRDGSIDYGTAMTIFSLEKPTDGRPATVGPRSRRQQDRGGHLHGRLKMR